MVDRALLWLWGRIESSAAVPARSLGVLRWVFGLYVLFFDARWFGWLDTTPDAFFDPPVFSIAYLFGGFPPPPVFAILDVVWILAILAMTIGFRTRLTTIIALVVYTFCTTFVYSDGKISHQIGIVMLLLCMAIADWGKATPRRVAQGLALLAVCISFGFLAAGFDKARYWVTPDLSISGFLSWYYPRMALQEPQLLAGLVPGMPLPLFKLADFAAVVFELGWFVALFAGRIPWRVWLFIATGFHFANALVLNITFTTQVVVYLTFVNLLIVPAMTGKERLWSRARVVLGVVAGLVAAWHIVSRFAGGGSFLFLGAGESETSMYDLYVCVAICMVALVLIGRDVVLEARAARAARAERRARARGGEVALRRSGVTGGEGS